MIICHFFTRVIKGTKYLMVDSSADKDSKPLYESPAVLFEAAGDRKDWPSRACDMVMGRFPDLLPGDVCHPGDNRKNKPQCFDIPFFEDQDAK